MSVLRFAREPMTEALIHAWGQDMAQPYTIEEYQAFEAQDRLRTYTVRAEERGVDLGLGACVVFVLLEDRTKALQVVSYLQADYMGLLQEIIASCHAKLRDDGVLTVEREGVEYSTEPDLTASDLPIRLRGGTRLGGVVRR